MITIRLLGGAKKAVGKPQVSLDVPAASIAEILQFLTAISTDTRLLQPNNLIVAVNGVDSAAIQGQQTVAKSGDTVTIVTVVHGGSDLLPDGYSASVIGVRNIAEDPGKLLDRIRADNNDAIISIQAVNAESVYGVDHVMGVLLMTLEAEKRNIMIAKRSETELLLRLGLTDQISEAIVRVGLKKGNAGCFIAFSKDAKVLKQFSEKVGSEFEVDASVLEPAMQKRTKLSDLLGIKTKFDDREFLQYLLERAAILVK
ncbi:MAG TPA: KEOPS complex subunit Cgi121 [Nitrososphaera sp.]|jgi:tRNA threonylcarbamoyladenosine modification (KEOPS) complex Cgi121 subunit/molybdopterin converting factor small subunit